VVLGVQFTPITGFTTAHAGHYWARLEPEKWTQVREVPALEDVFEYFDENQIWRSSGPVLRTLTGPEPNRIQFLNADGEHMLQLQRSRFVYNWRKREAQYPSFPSLLPLFLDELENFSGYVADLQGGQLKHNQWEVVYVNQIPRGDLWNQPSEWQNVIPAAIFPDTFQEPEALSAGWHYKIHGDRGRLHIKLSFVRVDGPQGPEALRLEFTARGPLDEAKGHDLEAGLRLGHETIVRAFEAITTKTAHATWQKK
jgi:uncharacterized protein (TIGR04255 family)